MLSAQRIKQLALQVGFDACGITPATPLIEQEGHFRAWLQAGYHSSLGYMERNGEKRFRPARLVEGAKSVVVCAVSYRNAIGEGYPSDCRTKIAAYATTTDYHTTLRALLHELIALLRAEEPTLQGRAFVDSAPLAEKPLAVAAGLGWIGRQSLLIHPKLGSFLHLGELVITAPVDTYDQPMEGVGCGNCHACREACPAGALVRDAVVDTARCIACQTIEAPSAQATPLHGWIFGCDACQSCCPYTRRAPLHRNPRFDPRFDPRTLTAEAWLTMSEEEFSSTFAPTPLARSGLSRIREHVQKNQQ